MCNHFRPLSVFTSRRKPVILKIINLNIQYDRLIALVQKKDRRAQEQLFTMFSPKMLSVCRYYLKSLPEAEEAMLNGFFKAFQHINSFQNQGSFEGWIRKIMVRECLSLIRGNESHKLFLNEEQALDNRVVNPSSQLESDYYQSLIDALPNGYKMVFVLYCIEGYKHREIADLLHITVGTSKSQLNRARQLLQAQLKNDKDLEYAFKKI